MQDDSRPAHLPDEAGNRTPVEASPDIGEPFRRRQYLLYGFFFKIRGLWTVLLLFAMFFTTCWESADALATWTIGLALFGAGFGLRVRSQQYLRYRLRDEGGLATAGPYAYVRNPVYIANITGLAGLCILCRLFWMAPIAAAWAALAYHLAVRFEEVRLTKRFGETYRRYCERVPRWIPRRPSAVSTEVSRAGLWKAVAVEWQSLVLLLVPVGKEWVFRPHAGKVHAVFLQALDFVVLHHSLFIAILAVGLAALAALNLARLHSVRSDKTRSGGVHRDRGR
jgi:protein-S-isoprenylcysteine O-methyltransferase Ste14